MVPLSALQKGMLKELILLLPFHLVVCSGDFTVTGPPSPGKLLLVYGFQGISSFIWMVSISVMSDCLWQRLPSLLLSLFPSLLPSLRSSFFPFFHLFFSPSFPPSFLFLPFWVIVMAEKEKLNIYILFYFFCFQKFIWYERNISLVFLPLEGNYIYL